MGKRTLQDNGTWLTTLQRPDVELIDDGVAEITADGVRTVDGVHRHADCCRGPTVSTSTTNSDPSMFVGSTGWNSTRPGEIPRTPT